MHGAAGAVGSMVTPFARQAGAYVIGTGRAADRQAVLPDHTGLSGHRSSVALLLRHPLSTVTHHLRVTPTT